MLLAKLDNGASQVGSEYPEATAALERAKVSGFRFWPLHADDGIAVVCGERHCLGAVDMCVVGGEDDAFAMRFRLDGDGRAEGRPLWKRHGTVVEVVTALVDLPPPGAPGAPIRELAATSDLWLPAMD
ncbi:MAG: hypothetical protein GEU98_05105 [Pseudonocardiaceae bacterium]|nr:hypothetical protein [Pseudonocardiaceae bacterium]